MPKADQLTEEIVMDINDLHDLRDGASPGDAARSTRSSISPPTRR